MLNQSLIYYSFLFLPGIVAVKTLDFIKVEKNSRNYMEFLLQSFLWSIVLYSIVQLIFPKVDFLLKVTQPGTSLTQADIKSLVITSGGGIFLSFFYNYIMKKGYVYQIFKTLKVTSAISNHSVFQDIYDYKLTKGSWTTIVMNDSPLQYIGAVSKYKLYETDIEILLEDVTVHSNETGEELHKTDFIYLRKPYHAFIIEYS